MPTPRASEEFYRTLQRLQLVLVAAGRRAWAGMGPDFDAAWADILGPLTAVVSATQFAAANAAAEYVPTVLEETGQPDAPEATVRPAAFAGVASDGRTLEGLLQGAVVAAKRASGAGYAAPEALNLGGRWLDTALSTAVSDAGRQATGVEIASRPRMGWVRMVNPPCCGRCAILAGRFYRWSSGFNRHPNCDCTHIPSVEDRADEFRTDPDALFARGHVRGLTKAEQSALADGADPSRVINARRGMYTTTVFGQTVRATTEATTARGIGRELGGLTKVAGQRYRRSAVVRLSPEGIYQVATDQADAIRLLRRYGYVT